jgi:hypothetical protein
MKIIGFTLIVISLLVITNCNQDDDYPHFKLQTPNTFTEEEYSIYSLVISFWSLGDMILIAQKTYNDLKIQPYTFAAIYHEFQGIDTTIIESFDSLRKWPLYLDKGKITKNGIITTLVPQEEFEYFIDYRGFLDEDLYTSRYPDSGPILLFSRIGFNQAKDEALVEKVSWYIYGADAIFIYLRKVNEQWEYIGNLQSWIADP